MNVSGKKKKKKKKTKILKQKKKKKKKKKDIKFCLTDILGWTRTIRHELWARIKEQSSLAEFRVQCLKQRLNLSSLNEQTIAERAFAFSFVPGARS